MTRSSMCDLRCAMLATCFVATFALADDQPTLDELLNIEPVKPAAVGPPTPEGVEMTESVRRRLEGERAEGTFESAVMLMEAVSVRLGRQLDAGIETQRIQEDILARLDRVIAAARRQQAQGGTSGSAGGSARQQDAGGQQMAGQQNIGQDGIGQQRPRAGAGGEHGGQASPGSVGAVDPNSGTMRQRRSEWGNLPPRLRDELSEGRQERFSPAYRELTEAYYQRLAQEQEE